MRLMFLWLLLSPGFATAETPANWNADHPPCNRHDELLKRGHMELGVRIATANPVLAKQFKRAMDSWARVLDFEWHEDDTDHCAIQVMDGEPELFQPIYVAARSHLPERAGFEGWIAFNPAQKLDATELFRIAAHEIGHVLGLQHSGNEMSVMYFLDLDGATRLDPADLAALAKLHKLQIADRDKPVALGTSSPSTELQSFEPHSRSPR